METPDPTATEFEVDGMTFVYEPLKKVLTVYVGDKWEDVWASCRRVPSDPVNEAGDACILVIATEAKRLLKSGAEPFEIRIATVFMGALAHLRAVKE